MMSLHRFALAVVVSGVLALFSSRDAHAALDEVVAAADVQDVQVAGQTVHVRERGSVREYAGQDGKIFAAKWKGHFSPALIPLLGTHRAEFEAAMQTRRRTGHAHLLLSTPNLVVTAFSRRHSFSGHVYLPQRLPQGVSIDALP